MKKILAILLFFMFTNSFFVGAFAGSDVKTVLKLNVSDSSVPNLVKAVKKFKSEYVNFCKDFGEVEICKGKPEEKFSSNYKNSELLGKIKDTNEFKKDAEKSFGYIVGFYDELTRFIAERDKLEKIRSDEINSQIAKLIEDIAQKKTDLLNQLKRERKAINDLEGSVKHDVNITELSKEEVVKTNPDLKKYIVESDKIKEHGDEDIYSEISRGDKEALEKYRDRLQKQFDKLEKETDKTKANADELESIKNRRDSDKKAEQERIINDLWGNLKEALEKEKNAFKDFDGTRYNDRFKGFVVVNNDKGIDVASMNTAIKNTDKNLGLISHNKDKDDKKNVIEKPELKDISDDDFVKLKSYLETEINVANDNADKLITAKNGAEQAELDKLMNDLFTEKIKEAGLLKNIVSEKPEVKVNDFGDAVDPLNDRLVIAKEKIGKEQAFSTKFKGQDGKTVTNGDINKEIQNCGNDFACKKAALDLEIEKVRYINTELKKIVDQHAKDKEKQAKERQKQFDVAWGQLMDKLETEKKAINHYTKRTVAGYKPDDTGVDLSNMNKEIVSINEKKKKTGNQFPEDLVRHKEFVKKPKLDDKNFDDLIKEINAQSAIADDNVRKLKEAEEQEKSLDIVAKLNSIFSKLKNRMDAINNLELAIYGRDVNNHFNTDKIVYETYDGDRGFVYMTLGYSSGPRVMNINKHFKSNEFCKNIRNSLDWNTVERFVKNPEKISNIESYSNWEKCLEKFIIPQAEKNIENMRMYIQSLQDKCPKGKSWWEKDYREFFIPSDQSYEISQYKLKNGKIVTEAAQLDKFGYVANKDNSMIGKNSKSLYEELKECLFDSLDKKCLPNKNDYNDKITSLEELRTAQNDVDQVCARKKCETFEQKIKNSMDENIKGMLGLFKENSSEFISDYTEKCVPNMNDKNCKKYVELKLGNPNFVPKNIGSIDVANESYLIACKNAVDAESDRRKIIEKQKQIKFECFANDEVYKKKVITQFKAKANENISQIDAFVTDINKKIEKECLDKKISEAMSNIDFACITDEEEKNSFKQEFKRNVLANRDLDINVIVNGINSNIKQLCDERMKSKWCTDFLSQQVEAYGITKDISLPENKMKKQSDCESLIKQVTCKAYYEKLGVPSPGSLNLDAKTCMEKAGFSYINQKANGICNLVNKKEFAVGSTSVSASEEQRLAPGQAQAQSTVSSYVFDGDKYISYCKKNGVPTEIMEPLDVLINYCKVNNKSPELTKMCGTEKSSQTMAKMLRYSYEAVSAGTCSNICDCAKKLKRN